MSRVQRGSSNCSFHSFVDFQCCKMENIQWTALKSSFLTGYKADWKRGLKKLPRMQQGHRNRAHTRGCSLEDKLGGPGPGASGCRARGGGRSTLCRTPCRPRGLHREKASSTRCPTKCNDRKWLSYAKGPQRATVVQAEDLCRGAPVTGFQERKETRQR